MEFKITKKDAERIVSLAKAYIPNDIAIKVDLKPTTDTVDAIAYSMRTASQALDEHYREVRAYDRGFRDGYEEAMWRVRRGCMPMYPKRCPCPDPHCYR